MMKTKIPKIEIYKATQLILNCKNEIGVMKKAVEQMYEVYTSLSHISAFELNDEEIMLPSGKAISPGSAAHCLLEMKRTAVFLRGIYKAIKKIRSKRSDKIYILYAGTGPYASLITPLLTLFNKEDIKVDLLDVNKKSLESAFNIIKQLGYCNFIDKVICQDATTYNSSKKYDIIISETMQAGLRCEPQVSIMQNLIPQIKEDGIFIPEKIIIDAKLNSKGIWNPDKLIVEGAKRINLGQVLDINKHTIHNGFDSVSLSLPEIISEETELKIYTTIQVFENEILNEKDCSLNLPLKYYDIKKNDHITSVEFWYDVQDSFPDIKSKLTFNCSINV